MIHSDSKFNPSQTSSMSCVAMLASATEVDNHPSAKEDAYLSCSTSLIRDVSMPVFCILKI